MHVNSTAFTTSIVVLFPFVAFIAATEGSVMLDRFFCVDWYKTGFSSLDLFQFYES